MQVRKPYLQQKEARQQNTSLLLRDLWRHGPLSKAMLAQRNGLTKATVSTICRELDAKGLIREAGQTRSGVGRPGDLIELNPSGRCSIGVEISTNYVAAGLTDLTGQLLWQQSVPIMIGGHHESMLTEVQNLITLALEQAQKCGSVLLGIGVGVPGVVNHRVNSPALGWKEVPLQQLLEQRFQVPVMVENKARAAAMAEALHGSARDAACFVYVSVGTDVRSSVEAAVVNDGFLFRGASGRGVDAGHMVLDPGGPVCACGQRGCWQAMTDVDCEVVITRQRLQAGEVSVLQAYAADQYVALDHRVIHQAAVEGDALAKDVVKTVVTNHAQGITNLVLLFDPELVVIGWETMVLPADFISRMRIIDNIPELSAARMVHDRLAGRGITPPKIVHAMLDPEVVMIGAAALLIGEFFRTPPAA